MFHKAESNDTRLNPFDSRNDNSRATRAAPAERAEEACGSPPRPTAPPDSRAKGGRRWASSSTSRAWAHPMDTPVGVGGGREISLEVGLLEGTGAEMVEGGCPSRSDTTDLESGKIATRRRRAGGGVDPACHGERADIETVQEGVGAVGVGAEGNRRERRERRVPGVPAVGSFRRLEGGRAAVARTELVGGRPTRKDTSSVVEERGAVSSWWCAKKGLRRAECVQYRYV